VPLLLCDLDDTVLSRREAFRAWAAAYLEQRSLPPGDVEWLVTADDDGYRARPELFASIVARYRLPDSPEEVAEHYYDGFLPRFRCAADVVDALTRARRAGFKLAIVTNGDRRAQEGKISAAGLGALVDAVCISGVEGIAKPAREIFELAASRCAHGLEAAWMVGDNPVTDIGGASACGVRTVWIRHGRAWPDHLAYRPDHQADGFAEAVDLVLTHH
jgi:putative hydrolase of the HAD superfamily